MAQSIQRLLIIIFFIFSFSLSNAQNSIKVKFIGNCGLHLTDGLTNIYVDFPYVSGAYGYMKYNPLQIDSIKNNAIFLFTHKHKDHYSKKIVKSILKNKSGKSFTQWKSRKLVKHFESFPNITIEVFKTKHRFSLRHKSYLITWNGKRIYLSGDTEDSITIGSIQNIDWAFLPPWILDDAKEKNIKIDANKIGLYHLYPSEIESAIEEWGQTKSIIPLTKQGDIIRIQ